MTVWVVQSKGGYHDVLAVYESRSDAEAAWPGYPIHRHQLWEAS